MTFFGRRRDRRPADQEVVTALRASLHAHARQAPRGEDLAERILAAVDEPAPGPLPRRRNRFAGWTPPLIAAATVAAVAAVAVGIAGLGSGPDTPPQRHALGSRLAGGPSVDGFGTHAPSPTGPAPAISYAPNGGLNGGRQRGAKLHDVRIVDLTFAGTDDGWALATADCLTGPIPRCTALLRTRNGRDWRAVAGVKFNAPGVNGCAAPCVEHIRFANDHVGYAFGPTALFMTTDGGRTWLRQPGGALALETFNDNVIRVTSPHSGCPGWCDVATQTAAIGSTVWTPVPLTASQDRVTGVAADNVYLARGGHDAYVLATQNPAGGASNETSTLYRSPSDGRTWLSRPEPCPQQGAEADSTTLAAGAQDDVAVLCVVRGGSGRAFVATSVDGGTSFAADGVTLPIRFPTLLAGDLHTVLVAAGQDGLVYSHDGGRTWTRPPGRLRSVTFVGFESPTVGRAITGNGRAIWTTRDAGRTWQRARIG